MNAINKKILKRNYNLKGNNYNYFPKTNKELKKLVENLIDTFGKNVDLNIINTSNIENFNEIFHTKNQFEGDVSEWDVSNGKSFNYMFSNCYKFNINLFKWDVSNGTGFAGTFMNCINFNSDLSYWDVSNGVNFERMFYNCKSFDADLSNWNTLSAKKWEHFATGSLLEKYPEKIPVMFKENKQYK